MTFDSDETLRRNRNRSWWQQRTRLERLGIIVLAIALIIIIALIVAICLVSQKVQDKDSADKSKSRKDSLCLTPTCVEAAALVLKSMDDTVNPCDDFYQFACGGYIKEAYIPDDNAEVSNFLTLGDVVKKQVRALLEEPIKRIEPKPFTLIKRFYNICMNTTAIEADGLNTIKRIIRLVGGWPVLEGRNWNENDFDWKTSTYRFRKHGLSTDNFIAFGIVPDARNSTLRILTLDQPQLDITRDNLLGGYKDELVKAYYDYMIDFAVLFGADRVDAEKDVRRMIEFKTEIAKISLSMEELRDPDATFNPKTIAQLQTTYPTIPWLELINNVLNRPDKRVFTTDEVNVRVPKYVEKLEALLSTSSKKDQANYAFFQTLRGLVDYLPEEIKDREQQFRSIYSGTAVKSPRWFECVNQISQYFQAAVGALYVRNHFFEDTKQEVSQMVSDVKNEFIKIIKNLEWMDGDTKDTAIDKAMSMKTHIGYPVEFLDDKKLEKYYGELNFTSNHYLEAANQVITFLTDLGLSEFNDPINTTDWRTRISTITINAGYVPHENSIQLPASILQGIFYNKDRPQYMNYGSMGYIIGHEITHGFDDQGKKYNKDGGLENWWADETNKAYAEKAKCFVEQYSSYTVPEVGKQLNGEKTQGENIADNGGIKEAYLAYNNWVERNGEESILPGLNYTAKQLFWIATANCWCSKERKESLESDLLTDVHSPSRYRVIVPFGNIPHFAKDFNCPKESKMIPQHKCQIW